MCGMMSGIGAATDIYAGWVTHIGCHVTWKLTLSLLTKSVQKNRGCGGAEVGISISHAHSVWALCSLCVLLLYIAVIS